MQLTPTVFAAVAVLGTGILILWSNPQRWVNRTVFSCSIHIGLWLSALELATTALYGQFWLRCTTAIAALIPLHFWLVKEAIATDLAEPASLRMRRAAPWVFPTVALSLLCFTEFFIPMKVAGERVPFGLGYYLYIAGSLVLYCALAYDTLRKIRGLTGGSRLALQVWLGGGCAAAAAILLLMGISAMAQDPRYIRLFPIFVLLFYAGAAFAITTHRIFDARQLLLVAVEKTVLVGLVAGVAFLATIALEGFLPEPVQLFAVTALGLWCAVTLSGWMDRWFKFYPAATDARLAAFTVSRRNVRVEDLEKSFVGVLKGWGQSDHALILCGGKGSRSGSEIEVLADALAVRSIQQLRWATPERLARERVTPERLALARFLVENRLGVLVIGEGPALTALIGVGLGASRRPFTYPQVTQLSELASIMENALERAHFSAKVQHTEQLATVGLLGASLAHEIRNPLVSIKTFVQLLPTRHHEPAFREKFFKLIGEEVGRIDQLTEQLLDLASPRTYEAQKISLHPLLHSGLDLVASKAAHKNIELRAEFNATPDFVYTDASAAKQVLLNLCFNAIQAVEGDPSERQWVKVVTRNTHHGIELMVADSGPGIAPEIRRHLFQPFQTTKSTGFGLGLAICSDILANLNASITVDPPIKGQGAIFRVLFPCQPSLS